MIWEYRFIYAIISSEDLLNQRITLLIKLNWFKTISSNQVQWPNCHVNPPHHYRINHPDINILLHIIEATLACYNWHIYSKRIFSLKHCIRFHIEAFLGIAALLSKWSWWTHIQALCAGRDSGKTSSEVSLAARQPDITRCNFL